MSPNNVSHPTYELVDRIEQNKDSLELQRIDQTPPEGPKPLSRPSLVVLLIDLVLTATPLFFIFLCVAALRLHNTPTQDNKFGVSIAEVTKYGATLFPFLFAAIVGRSMKMIALFSAQRGSTLGSLEMLTASQSLFAMMESQLNIRSFSPIGSMLLCLWVLYPLGSQASLRLLSIQTHSQGVPLSVRYMMTGSAAPLWDNGGYGQIGTEYTYMINSLFTSALLTSDAGKASLQDPWGNVKIPRIDAFNAATKDPNGWITVPQAQGKTSSESFSSLVGLPVVGVPTSSNSSSDFNLESSYWSLECVQPWKIPRPMAESDWNGVVGVIWNETDSEDATDPLQNSTGGVLPTFFLDTDLELDNTARLSGYFGIANSSEELVSEFDLTRKIIFGSLTDNGNSLVLTNCSISEVRVETAMNCTQSICGASKIRTSVLDTRPSQFTALDEFTIAAIFMTSLPENSVSSSSVGPQQISSVAEVFINGTSLAPFRSAFYNQGLVDLSLLSGETIATRLGIILNTFFQVSTFPSSFLGDQIHNMSAFGPNTTTFDAIRTWFPSNVTLDSLLENVDESIGTEFTGSQAVDNSPFAAASANGTETLETELYACSYAWLILLFISASILFAVGILGLIAKYNTLAPNIFSFVTSMTYHNQYVKLPTENPPLDSSDRTRSLQNLKVQIADVRGNDETGYIAFTSGMETRPLERGRKYL